jgi:hypothetical protein
MRSLAAPRPFDEGFNPPVQARHLTAGHFPTIIGTPKLDGIVEARQSAKGQGLCVGQRATLDRERGGAD